MTNDEGSPPPPGAHRHHLPRTAGARRRLILHHARLGSHPDRRRRRFRPHRQRPGSSPNAGAWAISTGSSTVDVANSQASFDGRPGSVLDARLPQTSVGDVDIVEKVTVPSLPSNGETMVGLDARQDASGHGYRLWFNLGSTGHAGIHLDRVSPSGDASVGSGVDVPGVVKAGQVIYLKLSLGGTSQVSVKGSIWDQGQSEPGTAQFSATDESPSRITANGAVGLSIVAGQQTMPVQVKHFTATTDDTSTTVDNPTRTPTTAPTSTATATATATAAPTTASPTATATATKSATTTPTTAPTTLVASGTAGAASIGSASYPVPSGAIYVATNGNDSNPGTEASPKATVLAAVNAAPSGGTVVVRGGVYHQANIAIFKPVTVENAPGEAVWFDGSSQVTNWTQSGSTWSAPWSTFFDHSVSFTQGQYDNQFLDANHPMAAWPDQVFVDGQQLEQVDISKGVGAGQFAVDETNKRLVIGANPSGHEVRASDLDRAFTVGSADVTLRGFGVRRYANALPRMGVLYLQRQRDVVENVEVDDVATLAISMGSDGTNGSGAINHVTIRRAGLGGIDGMMFDNGKVTNTLITDGNTQKFTPFPATGAIKVTRSKNVTFSNNVITDNYNTTGIWTDESTIGVTITGNRVTNSSSDGFAGIQTELTSKGVVADNVVSGNVRGIYVFDSNGMRVVNNTVWNSQIADISLDQDFRRQANASDTGHDPRNPVPDPNNTWISGNNTVNDNIFGTDAAFSNFQLWVLDKDKAIPASQMLTTANGNAFEAKDANSPTLVGWGEKMDGSVTQYNDLAAWSDAVGRGWSNTTYTAGSSPASAAQQVASTKGAPLDSDIASLIGQSAGSTHIGSFQQP